MNRKLIIALGVVAFSGNVFSQKIFQLSAGWFHTCDIDDSGLKCWGAIPAQVFYGRGPWEHSF